MRVSVLFGFAAASVSPPLKRFRASDDAEFLALASGIFSASSPELYSFPPKSYGEMIALISDRDAIDPFDCARAVPNVTRWAELSETVPSQLVGGAAACGETSEIAFEGFIGAGADSKIWTVLNGKAAIKYGSYCPCENDPIDPILVEALMLEMVAREFPSERLANKLIYYSGAMARPVAPGKVAVDICEKSGELSSVRYLITEKLGKDLWHHVAPIWASGAPRWPLAGELGIQVFRMMEKLHAKNIVHGDIHLKNLAFDETEKLLFIDFGRSRVINPTFDERQFVYEGLDLDKPNCHGLFTPWTMLGFQTSYRDDAFRTLLMMAQILHGSHVMQIQTDFCKAGETQPAAIAVYKAMKRKMNLFNFGIKTNSSKGVVTEHAFHLAPRLEGTPFHRRSKEIGAALFRLLNSVRDLGPFEKPDYEEIIRTLTRITQ